MSIVPKQEDAKTKIVYMGERLKRNKMEMSIDKAIKHLHTYSSTLGSGQTPQDQHEEAKRVAIDTMCKYKKIERILGEQGMPEWSYSKFKAIASIVRGNHDGDVD